jgi:hypothetical protein
MTIVHALVASVREWKKRLEALSTAPSGRDDDAEWWRMLDQSRIGRGFARSTDWLARARSESVSAQFWRAAAGAMPPSTRPRSVGVAAIVGSLVHVGFMARGEVVGYWWLILPAMAATFGFGAMVMSRFAGDSDDDGEPGR